MAANSVLSSTITCFRKRFKLNSHKKTTHPRFILISAPRFILISAPRFILISAPRFILISVPSIRSVPHPYPRFIRLIEVSHNLASLSNILLALNEEEAKISSGLLPFFACHLSRDYFVPHNSRPREQPDLKLRPCYKTFHTQPPF